MQNNIVQCKRKKIFAEIVEYHLGHEPFLPDQEEIEDDYEVEKIIFRSIDTNKLLITLGGGHQNGSIYFQSAATGRSLPNVYF